MAYSWAGNVQYLYYNIFPRLSNTELRMNMTRMSDKMDELLNRSNSASTSIHPQEPVQTINNACMFNCVQYFHIPQYEIRQSIWRLYSEYINSI